MKVYIKGFKKPLAVTGALLRKDDDNLVLIEDGVRKTIPRNKIAWVEEAEQAEPKAAGPIKNVTREDIREVIRSQIKKPEPVPVSLTDLNIFISGAEDASLSIRVPEDVLTGDHYTPALSKEISKNSEVRAIMDRGIIFDGVPTISGHNLYIKTRKLKETVSGAGASLQNIGLLAKAFQKPDKQYRSDFTMMGVGGRDTVESPWQGPVKLSEENPDVHSPSETDGGEGEDSPRVSGVPR